ncbi:clostripain-related cysteine peptidase [Clostridium scatologenes]|uniref:Alpha-clostripain-like protein n=1 Tax=Clostridium scatologenes TaxID=1548 RepID=A0A0E3GRK9_CLOSL|nr:clostripain-related cysteine peptidase [Clostridium scatologenes]AKA70501.1 alpha-clostripain-like protein [Clostridium scatologenes]
MKRKEWTILIYANGNNELEPEIWESKLDAEKVGSSSNISVVMQIGRESRDVVKIIRPTCNISFDNEVWTGVRRYYILKDKSMLLKDLGKVNMADYKTLYDFIIWGINTYKARKYMLILSGHGAYFVATLPDLSQSKPCMMGVSEMCKAINLVKADTGVDIDILVLDMCYMNLIEIVYELGKNKVNTTKNILTYIERGPLIGMPYSKIIACISKSNTENDVNVILKNIVENLNLDLVAIKVNHEKLKKIKYLVSRLAYNCLNNNEDIMSSFVLSSFTNSNNINQKYVEELKNKISSLIIHSKIINYNNKKLINIVVREKYGEAGIEYFLPYYYKLSFSKNNFWTNILSNKKLDENINFENVPPGQFIVAPRGLRNIIWTVNYDLTEDEVNNIVKELYSNKHWDYSFDDISKFTIDD